MTTRWRWSPRRKCAPAAWPTRSAVSAVIGSALVVPRIPSVPKNFRVITRALARLADPAPEARGGGMQPGRKKKQQGAANQRHAARITKAACERNKARLGRPVMPILTHQFALLDVLSGRPGQREQQD